MVQVWKSLRDRYPATFTVSATQVRAWHQREAEVCEAAQLWEGAIMHLQVLLEADPKSGPLYSRHGQAQAALGRWRQASADFAKAEEFNEDTIQLRGWHALACAGARDPVGQRKVCSGLLEGFGKTRSTYADVFHVAWFCARFPDTGVNPVEVVAFAEKAVLGNPNLGAVLYRAGRFKESIQSIQKSKEATINTLDPQYEAPDWLFLAMAHHRLGHAEEAKKWLTKAEQWLDQALAEKPKELGGNPLPWDRKLELQLLRREAEELILGKKP
jgi:tetratricopeptide (TPR) repeat protein